MASWGESGAEVYDLDALKAGCDLREIIVSHLEKARPVRGGEYWVGCCPFHNDTSPSFLVYPHRYQCRAASCGEYGTIIDWVHHTTGLEGRELYKHIEEGYAGTFYPPTTKRPAKITPLLEEPLQPSIDLAEAGQEYQIEHPDDRIMGWIYDHWLLSRQTVEKERIAYSQSGRAVVIPVWGYGDDLITLRFRNVDNPHMGKYWGIPGRNAPYGYGRAWVKNADHAVVVMGEMTACFLHHEWGLASFSWTNGCQSFKPYLIPLLSHLKGGVVVPDVGEDDEAACVANMLGAHWQVALLERVGGLPGEDVIDWVRRRGTRRAFCDLILNKAAHLKNGVLPYFQNTLNAEWKR